ncbi:MAG: hypothetical protein E7241_00095 [Lachnospiraceae bacterium]|nr:hypothetical protein [Lachnospiraceae bacterium]
MNNSSNGATISKLLSEENINQLLDSILNKVKDLYFAYRRGLSTEEEMRINVSNMIVGDILEYLLKNKSKADGEHAANDVERLFYNKLLEELQIDSTYEELLSRPATMDAQQRNGEINRVVLDTILNKIMVIVEAEDKQAIKARQNVVLFDKPREDKKSSFIESCEDAYCYIQCIRKNHGWVCGEEKLILSDDDLSVEDEDCLSYIFVNGKKDEAIILRRWINERSQSFNYITNLSEVREMAPKSFKKYLGNGLDYFYQANVVISKVPEKSDDNKETDGVIRDFYNIPHKENSFQNYESKNNIVALKDYETKTHAEYKELCAEAYAWIRYLQRTNGWYSDDPMDLSLRDGSAFDNGGTARSALFVDETLGKAIYRIEFANKGFKLCNVTNLEAFMKYAPTSYRMLTDKGLALYRIEGAGFKARYIQQQKIKDEEPDTDQDLPISVVVSKQKCEEAFAWIIHLLKDYNLFCDTIQYPIIKNDCLDDIDGQKITSLFEDPDNGRAMVRVDYPEDIYFRIDKITNLEEVKERMPNSYDKMIQNGLKLYQRDGKGFKAFYPR